MHFHGWKRRTALFGVALVAAAGVAVIGPSGPVQAAEPQCQNGGVLTVHARGSGAGYDSTEAQIFFESVETALGSIPSAQLELGDQNDDDQTDLNGYYAAHAPWAVVMPENYRASVAFGLIELIDYLNRRSLSCPREAIVIGGYSQGAQVVAAAMNDPGLSQTALNHIAHVALYGDPKFNGVTARSDGCWRPQWVRGNVPCRDNAAFGVLQPLNPYTPSVLEGLTTSWCDAGDAICIGDAPGAAAGGGTHTTAYTGPSGWIVQSAPEIAHAAWLKTIELNPQPPAPPPPSVNPAPGYGPKLAATKNQDGRLGLFYVGGDSNIYYQYQLTPGGYWGVEKKIPAYAKGIAATTSHDGRIELFYVGGDNAVYHRYQTAVNSDSWSAEERFAAGALSISAARNGAGRIELVITGTNNALYILEQTAPDSWGPGALDGTGWQHIPSWAKDVAMTTSHDGRNEIFYVGSTGVLMHRWQTTVGDAYPNEEGFSASILKTAATRNQDGRLEVFAVGDNSHLFNKWQWQPNTPWYDSWGPLTGKARYITAARNHDGRLELFHVGLNNRIYHQWQQTVGSNWSGESLMYGGVAP
jgi:hypothetical protein